MVKRAFIVAAALLIAGCSARVQVNAGSGVVPAASGNSIAGGPGGRHIHAGSHSFAAAIIAISLLAGAMPQPPEPAPALAPERRVNEQDCTRPIEDWSGNLKCR